MAANATREFVFQLFSAYDADRNNTINREEFSSLCYDLGHNLSAAQIAIAFTEIDRDGNNEIDFNEFFTWWRGNSKIEFFQQAKTEAYKAAIELFKKFDIDRSGSIDKKEWIVLWKELFNCEKLNRSEFEFAKQNFFEADRDNSGTIELKEYINWLTSMNVI
eukprot:TRINITY_DN1050_c2_g3_i1.p1 TRINITY_DN1050_c2_g3~~TRINITY_DN1050_c2_g3_i1.p1  ORF type:complete len:162 (-),score=73.46 TRINITY_DN1050_c2_g3_i1:118-603(-)